jgi:hypothetical protein
MNISKNTEYLIVSIDGGLGKVIASTAAVRCLKKAHPDKKIIVLSGWPEVYDLNPHVYRTLRFNEYRHMYEDYAKKSTLLIENPYHLDSYRHDGKHLTESFCEAWQIEFDGNYFPEIYLDDELISVAHKKLIDIKTQTNGLPIIVVQYVGRMQKEESSSVFLPSGRENILLFNELMNKISDKCVMLIMKDADQPVVNVQKNTLLTKEQLHFRYWMATIAMADGFLGIDSCGHHMAAAFRKPAFVVWGRTDANALGYQYPGVLHVRNSECDESPCNGIINAPIPGWKCKYNYKCMKAFNVEKLTEKICEHFNLNKIDPAQIQNEENKTLESKSVELKSEEIELNTIEETSKE